MVAVIIYNYLKDPQAGENKMRIYGNKTNTEVYGSCAPKKKIAVSNGGLKSMSKTDRVNKHVKNATP